MTVVFWTDEERQNQHSLRLQTVFVQGFSSGRGSWLCNSPLKGCPRAKPELGGSCDFVCEITQAVILFPLSSAWCCYKEYQQASKERCEFITAWGNAKGKWSHYKENMGGEAWGGSRNCQLLSSLQAIVLWLSCQWLLWNTLGWALLIRLFYLPLYRGSFPASLSPPPWDYGWTLNSCLSCQLKGESI